MEIIVCALFGAFILLSYTLGLKNGQKLSKQEKIVVPKAISKPINEAKLPDDMDAEQLSKIISNIDTYNGTAEGQVKI